MLTRRLCVVICGNGLGHFVREMQIISALLGRAPGLQVTIACAEWQLDARRSWPLVRRVIADSRVTMTPVRLYPRWTTAEKYFFDDTLLTWQDVLGPLHLDSYDLVLSDNFVETLQFAPRAMLVGSFMWHDVYAAYRPESPVVREYHRRCSNLLEQCGPSMIANRYLAMPAVSSETDCIGVGMLPSLVKHAQVNRAPRGVLFSASGESPAIGQIRAILAASGGHVSSHDFQVLIDARLAPLVPMPPSAKLFDYQADDLGDVAAVVARPGMGTVTDSVVSSTPLFCLSEENPEMIHNAERVEALGLGWRLSPGANGLSEIASVLSSGELRQQYSRAVRAIDRDGLEQATEVIARHLD